VNIVFNTWAGAFFNPGGGETQLMETRRHLECKGISVELYDQWKPQRNVEIFHQFSIVPGVEYAMAEYRALNIPIALSTILWVDLPKGNRERERILEILKLADILFTNSTSESELLSRVFEIDRNRFHETRNSVADDYLNQKTTADFRSKFSIDGEFVLSVANIDRRKNTKSLVEACRRLNKTLILVGETRDIPYFKEIELSEGVRCIGAIRDVNLLKSAYQQASVYALPSLCETPGIAALEAASQGCPIAITSEGSARDYFGDAVTYVDPLDIESIAQGIALEIYAKRDTSQLAERICKQFSWTQTAEDVLNGYQKVLRGKPK
jgi:glycosyltransferase involved in cell wall biosynthesis